MEAMLDGFNKMTSIAADIASLQIETDKHDESNQMAGESTELPKADKEMFWKWIVDGKFMDCAQLLHKVSLSASELRRAKMILMKKADSFIKKPSGATKMTLIDAIKALEVLGVDSSEALVIEALSNCLGSIDSDFTNSMETILDVAKALDLDINSALSKIGIPDSKLLCLALILGDSNLSMSDELFTRWLHQITMPKNIPDLLSLSNNIAKQSALRSLPRKWLIELQQKIELNRLNDQFQGRIYQMRNLLTPLLGSNVDPKEFEGLDAAQLFASLGLPRVSRLL